MYQALYRKYRPVRFDDVCGQEHITSVLKTQLQKGRVSHAYIFCGSRGTGKTSCAKILAKAVNCLEPQNGEPCNHCEACRAIDSESVLDVVEMDAASNNGVDAIRRLCDEVQYMPSECKKRVYIIDEVHMLSTSAFNALLKTIEEPPAHVLFILATTEMNDIPATIMSRCQRFDFKRLSSDVISARLLMVAEKENILLEKPAAEIFAKLSDGAMRDALSLLEACQGQNGPITAKNVRELLGLGSRENTLNLCHAIARRDVAECLSLVDEIYERMSDFKEVISDLIALYRDLLVMKTVKDPKRFVECYEDDYEALEKILPLVTAESVLYQAKVLEDFYVSFDKIATGKKSSSEILMIRLCNESLDDRKEALLSRIAKLEKAISEGNFSSNPIQTEEKQGFSERKTSESASLPKSDSFSDGAFEGAVRLKNKLQEEAFIKPWLSQLEFFKQQGTLIVRTGAFVKGMLVSTNAHDTILSCAKEIDSSLVSIQMEEKKNNPTTAASGLEEL